ncbi:MAG: hypothetical protein E7352_07410 [Clostridiales bacterium]|nr:hypothetical protein [Clostridiales bacterium]
MNITGATFNFTKKVTEEDENSSPEKPVDGDRENKPKAAGDKKKQGDGDGKNKGSISAFAYDMIKAGVQQTLSAVTSNVSGSPTLQIQLQAAQQVGGKIIAYTAAIASKNWVALGVTAMSDAISIVSKNSAYMRDKAWSDYDLDQYRERRGYSTLRNRK